MGFAIKPGFIFILGFAIKPGYMFDPGFAINVGVNIQQIRPQMGWGELGTATKVGYNSNGRHGRAASHNVMLQGCVLRNTVRLPSDHNAAEYIG